MDLNFKILSYKGVDFVVYKSGKIWRCGYYASNGKGFRFVDGQFLTPTDNSKGYQRVHVARVGNIRVHRLVAMAFLDDYSDDLTVDHINGDKSDNKVENLRMMSHKQNMRSFQKARGGASQYRGVTRKSCGGKWVAQINVDGKITRIGSYDSEKEAAIAYNREAKKHKFSNEAMNCF